MARVLVIGATGRVGSALAADLQSRGQTVRAAVRQLRQPPPAGSAQSADVLFDFDRPETFDAALEGVDRVFLIARPGDDEADRVAAPLVEAMRRHRIEHVVNLTAMGVERLPDTALRKLERIIEESGIGVTHLRPNFFMQIFAAAPLLPAIRTQGVLAVPAGGAALSFVDARDVAAVAAVALTEPGHRGRAYTLTGGEAISHREVAEAITRASGRAVRYVALDEESARRIMTDAGLSPARADRLIGFYRQVRAGHCSPVSGDIERVLGRPPMTFERFAHNDARAWMQG